MAMVDMQKVSLIGLHYEKSQIINDLMSLGVLQIDATHPLSEEGDISEYLEKDGNDSKVILLDQIIFQINQAIGILSKAKKRKSAFLESKKEFQKIGYDESKSLMDEITEINELNNNTIVLKNEENSLNNFRDSLMPWINFDIAFNKLETKSAKVILGTISAETNINIVRQKLDETVPQCLINSVNTDKKFNYVYLVSHKAFLDDALNVLREFGFAPIAFTNVNKMPAQEITLVDEKIIELQLKRDGINSKLINYADNIETYENLYDFYQIERDQVKIRENLVKTKKTFYITGWVPSNSADMLRSALMEKYTCTVNFDNPNSDDEDYPILLNNNKAVEPYEMITNMYSSPSRKDVDPNTIMSVFYFIFFGMMLSDAAYGLIISIVCGLIIYKKKFKKGEGSLFKIMFMCGVSTTFWGIIFGGAFGDLLGIKAIIDPLQDVMILMGMSLLFGIIHIYMGLAIKGYMLIKAGHILDAIFDIGLWYIFVTGVIILIVPVVGGDIGAISTVGKYMSIAGAIGLILTQGRKEKGIKKMTKGISSLYDITGYFADILSYTRIMALCLSTGVIAQVINLLGDIAGPIPAVIIGVIGHGVNLAINALGAYVHTSRLQYVEFFGKFFEGGGIPFNPFKYKTKYTSVNREGMQI